MQTEMLWAGVCFSALGGRTDALLQSAAEQSLRLRDITACPGGFTARCGAHRYHALARLARHYHVRLRIRQRKGLYFPLRATLHRAGLWAGLLFFGLMILYSQHLIWNITYVDLTLGQQARVAAILREYGMQPGVYVQPEMLTKGETALVEDSGEFGWASLNFEDGRLTVEAAPAEPVPAIEQLRYTDICAKTAGTVLSLDVERGTAAVVPGQLVTAGQVLIAVNRTDRAGKPVAGCASGKVQAQFIWSFQTEQPLCYEAAVPQGRMETGRQLLCLNYMVNLPATHSELDAVTRQRHSTLEIFGMALPVAVCETEYIPYETQTVNITESLALAKARLAAQRALAQEWPDAHIVTVQEDTRTEDNVLYYSLSQTIEADICDTAGTERMEK